MSRIAVITGDLINSTKVSNAIAFREKLKDLMNLVNEKYNAQATLYRGDGFQVALDAGTYNAFEVAVIIRTGLVSSSPDNKERWDARVAIAFENGTLSLIDQNSDAFVNSGRTLDAMEKEHFCVYGNIELSRLALGISTSFADDVINQLTAIEAEVLFHYFLYREKHKHIARRLEKKRPTITKALQRAKYTLIDRYTRDMDKFLKQLHD